MRPASRSAIDHSPLSGTSLVRFSHPANSLSSATSPSYSSVKSLASFSKAAGKQPVGMLPVFFNADAARLNRLGTDLDLSSCTTHSPLNSSKGQSHLQ